MKGIDCFSSLLQCREDGIVPFVIVAEKDSHPGSVAGDSVDVESRIWRSRPSSRGPQGWMSAALRRLAAPAMSRSALPAPFGLALSEGRR